MIKYIFKRTLTVIPVLIGVLIIVFSLNMIMPGDPVVNKLGDKNQYEEEQWNQLYAETKHKMGLDQGYFERLGNYFWGIITRGDLGTSYADNQPVTKSIGKRLGATVRLGILSVIAVAIMGIPIGIFSAIKRNTIPDYTITTFSIMLASMPNFVMAMFGVFIFSVTLKWLPASGLKSWQHYILPVLCNSLMMVASIVRMTRSSMLEVIRQDYIRTARAKGLSERKVILKHALRNALIPVVTTLGGMLGAMIGGMVVIETVFNIPGMGTLLVSAISNRDYPMIMAITLVICVFVCLMNLLVDLAYAAIDPRIRNQFAARKAKRRRAVS